MFTDMMNGLPLGELPDLVLLRKRFDIAMTKKLAVVKLPPAFWTKDSKINPRTDHLLTAALLLGDQERIDFVRSVIASELCERKKGSCTDFSAEECGIVRACGRELIERLLAGGAEEKAAQVKGVLEHACNI